MWVHPTTVMVGNLPSLTVATPTHFPQERGGFVISLLMFVSGRDDVGTFGAKWGLGRCEMW